MPKSPTIDHEVIRELARLLDETGLTEIAIEQDGVAVRVARHTGFNAARTYATELPVTAPGVAATAPPLDPAQHPGVVASPMVGTAYRATGSRSADPLSMSVARSKPAKRFSSSKR